MNARIGRTQACLGAGAVFALALATCQPAAPAQALPMYALRSGRTCANCHESPTLDDPDGWVNPDLSERKCNMSCMSCHVSPTGGGLRNTGGRYYGRSTMAMFHTEERSYSDNGRELLPNDVRWKVHTKLAPPMPAWGASSGDEGPEGDEHAMAFWDSRYDDLNADPTWQLGGDFRVAWWSGNGRTFPMQANLHGAWHPAEHITAQGTIAATSRQSRKAEEDPGNPVYAREATVMLHELPYMSWVRAGTFLPAYGMYIDDHTKLTREWVEQDVSSRMDTVYGVEVGTAPNYPHASISAFANKDGGWGTAVTAGWRDLAWSFSGSTMIKQRGGQGRGDLAVVGFSYGFNPFELNNHLPLTLMGETSVGQRTLGGTTQVFMASHLEAWWMLRNGINARLLHEVGNTELGTPSWQHRSSAGLDITPIPGLTLSGIGRVTMSPGAGVVGQDVLLQAHVWF